MWIRSKFEQDQINHPVNTQNTFFIFKDDHKDGDYIHLCFNAYFSPAPMIWSYKSKEDRDQEYEWILSQLDCRVNDGNENKPEDRPEMTTNIDRIVF
jgi:hypothetical protein